MRYVSVSCFSNYTNLKNHFLLSPVYSPPSPILRQGFGMAGELRKGKLLVLSPVYSEFVEAFIYFG